MINITALILSAIFFVIIPTVYMVWQLFKIRIEVLRGYKNLQRYEQCALLGGPMVFIGAQIIKSKAVYPIEIAFSELFIVIGGAMVAVGIIAFMKEMHWRLPSNK